MTDLLDPVRATQAPAAGPPEGPARAPDRLVRWLAAGAALVALGDAFVRLTYTGRPYSMAPPGAWLHSSTEGALQTWFAAGVMALVGLTCLRRRDPPRRWWWLVGVLFCYLAADDVLMVHERVGELLYPLLAGGHGVYVWVLVLGPPFALAGALGGFHLHRALAGDRRRRLLLLAGFAALALALVFEIAEDRVTASAVRLRGLRLLDYAQWCEETLELFGPVLLLGAVRAPRQCT